MQKNHTLVEGSQPEALLIDKLSDGRYRECWDQIKTLKGRLPRVTANIAELHRAPFWKKLLSKNKLAIALLERDEIVEKLEAAQKRVKEIAQEIRGSAAYKQAVAPTEKKPSPLPTLATKIVAPVLPVPQKKIHFEGTKVEEQPRGFSITVRPARSTVDHLFETSVREDWPTPPPGARTSENIYLPVNDDQIELVTRLGARVGPKGGVFVAPGTSLDALEQWLPFYAKKHIEPLNVDSIPDSNWGGSLANLLLASSWQAIRQSYVDSTGNKCTICGYPSPGDKSIDCHEIWEYHRPKRGNVGIQRLINIVPVCDTCHLMFHLGLANIRGHLDATLARLSWVNRWNGSEVDEYYKYQGNKWHQRNEYSWMLDVSALKLKDALVLKGGKTGVTIDDGGNLHFQTFNGTAGSTRFLGAEFGHKKSPRPAHPVPSYSDFVKDV